MNACPEGTKVFFWDAKSQLVYGIVQSTNRMADGTQVLVIKDDKETAVTLPEVSYPVHPAIDPTSSIHPLFSHPERHLLLNERSLTANDFRNGLQHPTNFTVAPGAEQTDSWIQSSISGQELAAQGSSNISLSSSIALPSSISAAWTSCDLILDPSPAEIYNQMITNESESFYDGSDANRTTQENLSFWMVDSNTRAKHYQCECGKITKSKSDMRRHRQSLKHSGKSHSCPCGGSYTRRDSLKRHAQVCRYAAGNVNNA